MNVVFAVGCSRYDDPDVAALKYAHRDAQKFGEAVASAQDPGDTEVFLLHDEQENTLFHPTRGNILRLLSRGAHRDKSDDLDFLYFFFSGHGFRSLDEGIDYYFVSDSSASALEDTAISSVTLEKFIRRWEAKYTVLFLDACRAVAEGGKSVAVENASKVDVGSLCPSGMVTFCSCRPGEISYEADAISSGVFTEGIFRAFGDEGRCSTIEQLDAYLTDQIPRISRKCGTRRQTPYSRVEPLPVRNALIVSQRIRKAWQSQEHKQATSEAATKQESIRRYRENVESVWADGQLNESEAKWLKDRAKALGLSVKDVNEIERDVMGGTRRVILTRQKQATKEQEKIERQKWLDEKYTEARRFHRAQDWRVVVEVFDQIRAEDPTYSDPEGLLNSARQALQQAEEEQDTLRRYHGAVQSAWADSELDKREVESLRHFASKLKLTSADAARVEREVMGDTKEAVRYRGAVQSAWADKVLDKREVESLREIALEVKFNSANAARVEREVMGDTKEAVQRNHYRKAVLEEKTRRAARKANRSWLRKRFLVAYELERDQAEKLRDLANKLGLGTEAAEIEREILGTTVQELRQRYASDDTFMDWYVHSP